MDHSSKPSSALFDVFLRLRPSNVSERERFLDVEQAETPTHITIQPPANDNRRRAVEKFAFTRVYEEDAGQLELFKTTGVIPLLEGVLGQPGHEGRDGLLATLGVTGSGKSHTILGSRSQRGLTQLSLDTLFRHTEPYLADVGSHSTVFPSLCAADVSEAHLLPGSHFLDSLYGDGMPSRAATPAMEASILSVQGSSKKYTPRLSMLPQSPSIEDVHIEADPNAEYAVVVSMYEVYNDRIFDLLTASASNSKAPQKRRPLLFKNTERSPDRKVVAGLKKVVCSSLDEALLVLETGLHERRVAGTNNNAVSSRSHGFFCVEVKKRHRGSIPGPWASSTMTIVDLAGSERARTAKTAGATLAEAGKINESLMYLGQCMQMQSDNATSTSSNLVPFRQCKLTELLFSNSFTNTQHKAPQKAIMVVTADPLGDFNATSQILRYSALAREVTVPRIPSVTSTILAPAKQATAPGGRTSPSAVQEELEHALDTLARLREELEVTQLQLKEEKHRRIEAESSWKAAETRIEDVETEVREELWEEFESRLAQEQRRWRAARDLEMDAQDEHLDRKLDIVTRGMVVYDDGTGDKENVNVNMEQDGGKFFPHLLSIRTPATRQPAKDSSQTAMADLEDENAALKERLALMEREKGLRSPSKKMRVLKSRKWDGSGMGVDEL
ncbi:hypothetical protein MBLNU230_g3423t1 [Neophaeotheca triangularis]